MIMWLYFLISLMSFGRSFAQYYNEGNFDLDAFFERYPFGGEYPDNSYTYGYGNPLTPQQCTVLCYNQCAPGYVYGRDQNDCPNCICVPKSAPTIPNQGPVPNPGPIVPNPGPVVPNPGPIVPNPGPVVSNPGPIVPDPGQIGPNPGPINEPSMGYVRPNPYPGYQPLNGDVPATDQGNNNLNDLLKKTNNGLMLEGDMIITPSQVEPIKRLYMPTDGSGPRAIINSARNYWTEYRSRNNYLIPYFVDASVGQQTRSNLPTAFSEFSRHTCIKFIPRTTQRDYVHISNGGGCSSYVGKVGGGQRVSLSNTGCFQTGTIVHELMHALGFFHEQSRNDRDQYIRINYQNIQSGAAENFRKQTNSISMGVPYDYLSIMHYRLNAFSSNRLNTITPLRFNGNQQLIGNGNGLSKLDVRQINKLYKCDISGTNPDPQTTQPPPTTRPWWKTTTTTRRPKTTTQPATSGIRPPLTTRPPRSTTTPPRTRPGRKCQDSYPSHVCSFYERNGYCDRFKRAMETGCARSCKLCRSRGGTGTSTPAAQCFDRTSFCRVYKERNLCQLYRGYTQYMCRKSCDFC